MHCKHWVVQPHATVTDSLVLDEGPSHVVPNIFSLIRYKTEVKFLKLHMVPFFHLAGWEVAVSSLAPRGCTLATVYTGKCLVQ